MLSRYASNPILEGDPKFPWRSTKVYNCSVYKSREGKYQMLFRAIGVDWISRIGYAESTDGVNFTAADSPVLEPKFPWESKGCEDPRLTKIGNIFWLSYTAFDGKTARSALTTSVDLKQFGMRKLIFPHWQHNARAGVDPDWSKSGAIFPEKINGHYYMLFGDSHIWLAKSSDLIDWTPETTPLFQGRTGEFDAAYAEMGPPPILTDRGWLVLYHGIDSHDSSKTYRLGAALLDRNDPGKVLWRGHKPLLEPSENYETVGFVDVIDGGFETLKKLSLDDLHHLSKQEKLPKAVFCCSAILEKDDNIRLYYGAGDTVICTATVDLDTIFQL